MHLAALAEDHAAKCVAVVRHVSPDVSALNHAEMNETDVCPPLLEEVQDIVQKLKNNRAAGFDEISAEVLKWGGDAVIEWLHQIIVAVWDSETAPSDWKKALIVPVFKSGDACVLDNYRGISLLSIPGKVYSMVIGHRLRDWADKQLLEVQSGFRPYRGCNDAIFALRRVHEEALKQHRNLYTCFVDLSKAYDSIDRHLAWRVFESRGVPVKLLNLLKDLHADTYCALKGDFTNKPSWFEVKTGFKHGDVNAPMLFNLFIDSVIRCIQTALRQSGVRFVYKMDGQLRESKSRDIQEIAWILMFADDIALITESEHDMQEAVELLDQTFAQWGLEMSMKKTKVLLLSPTVGRDEQLIISRGSIDYVEQFKYLGSTFSMGLQMQNEISARLAKAGSAFFRLNRLWSDRHVSVQVRCSVYKTIVQATLLYSCEAWAVTQALLDCLDTFQMRCLRRICHISLREKRTNSSILEACKMKSIRSLVRYRRLRWLGHMARMSDDRLPKQLLFGSMQFGEHSQVIKDRAPKCWSDYVREDLIRLKMLYTWDRIAKDRSAWSERIETILDHT